MSWGGMSSAGCLGASAGKGHARAPYKWWKTLGSPRARGLSALPAVSQGYYKWPWELEKEGNPWCMAPQGDLLPDRLNSLPEQRFWLCY